MNNKNILSTILVLLIILFSGCIASETNLNKNIFSGETRNDIFHNKTLMFKTKMPQGWKSDVMWQLPYGGAINFVNDKYPWWPSGDDGAIRTDLVTYGTLALVRVSMDTQLVPAGYTLEYARSQELKRPEGIIYEGYTKLGGETAWEVIRKYRTVGDLYQRDIHIIHGKRSFVLNFNVISTDVEKRDNVTVELEPDFNEIITSFKFLD
ncbi:MAG: hypothetical protein FIB07_09155 [Candidatus Methanoperedens sp.]|nr:hypothetical protein [Candidatus Methanoperedens sp.]